MWKLKDYQFSLFLQVARRGIVMTESKTSGFSGIGPEKGLVRLSSLLKEIDAVSINNFKNAPIRALVWDSRQVVAGSVFFAIRGEKSDGNDYIQEAIRRGAIAIITDTQVVLSKSVSTIEVKDVRIALAKFARKYYGKADDKLHLVGITGTNGKTTVSRIVKHLLDNEKEECGLIGTIDYVVGKRFIPAHRTTPEVDEVCALLAEMKEVGCNSAVMEVSSHGVHQDRVYGIKYDTVAFLNLTRDHLDYHGSMENYYQVKASLFKGEKNPLPKNAIINIDEPYGERLCGEISKKVRRITISCHKKADFEATDIHTSAKGTVFTLYSPEGRFMVNSPLLGSYNVSNMLAGFACGYAAGKSLKEMLKRIETLPPVPGRLEVVDEGQDFLTLVDYAHTHDALDNALHTVRSLSDGKLIVVFGCGGDRDREKRPLMMETVCRYADAVWATSDNPRNENQSQIFDDMLHGIDGHTRVSFLEDRESAIFKAIASAEKGDAVVIAGKGHETYQILKDTIVPFDDCLVARAAIREANSFKTVNP